MQFFFGDAVALLRENYRFRRDFLLCFYQLEYGRILKSLNIVNFYRGMSKLKLKINIKVPQLLCIVVSAALNDEFERFGGFCVDCCYNAKPTKSLF